MTIGDSDTTASVSTALSESWEAFCSVCLLEKKGASFVEMRRHIGGDIT